MLTIFDGSNGYPISQDDYYIRQLASGYDEVVFNVNIRDPIYQFVREEAVIRDRDQNIYLIKQIDAGDTTAKVVAQIDLDDWKSELHIDYSNNSATVAETVTGILPAGWGVVDQSGIIKRRTIPTSDTTKDYNVTGLKILEDCTSVYDVRFRFNTASKLVYIINPASFTSRGAFATRDLNLKQLNYKGKSDNFVTRLYAEGADGMTFASINDGKAYVENRTYADKIVCAFWKDERYTDPQSLLEDAQAKVDEMGIPSQSYDCDVLDLANTNPDIYGFEDFSLFEVITLIDDAKNVRTDYQVVERWDYPYYPVNNKVMLSTSTPNIQSAIATVINSLNSSTSTFLTMLQSAITNATSLITGNSGGYLVLHDSDSDGTPDELLIMNTPDIETATKVWRWNQAGLGYSPNGYNGPYEIGITMDGAIVADFITAGHLNGDIITAGTLQASALSVEAQEEYGLLHNFLPYDVSSNAGRWYLSGSSIPAGTPLPYIATIDGEQYIAFDGRTISSYNDIHGNCLSDFFGDIGLKTKMKIRFSADYTPAQASRFFCAYCENASGSARTFWRQFVSGYHYTGGTDYEFDFTTNVTDSYQNPMIQMYYQPGVIMYVKDFECTSASGDYSHASMEVSSNGLSSVVQKGNVISSINQSAESVSIQASKINLTGDLSLRGDFKSYKSGDNTTYAFLDSGNLSFFSSGINVFTIASTALYGSYAGIFFGDAEDPSSMASHTYVTQEAVTTPKLYAKSDSRYDSLWSRSSGIVEGEFVATESFFETVKVNPWLYGTPHAFRPESSFTGDVYFYDHNNNCGIYFYPTVYDSSGGVVFVSDKRKKKNIKDLVVDAARSFIMALKPRKFKFKKELSGSGRYHHGFIAQEVKEAMDEDWGIYIEDKESDFIGLRYDELLADMVSVIQDQQKRIEALERRVDDLTNN